MELLSIDPGNTHSAWLLFDGRVPRLFGIAPNADVLDVVRNEPASHLAIEFVESFGMAVGAEVFQTAFWAGRFAQAFPFDHTLMFRKEIKIHLCGTAQAKDPNVRQRLIDLYGGEAKAIGGDKCRKCHGKGWYGAGRPVCPDCSGGCWLNPPGPLANITADLWSALAIAVTWWDRNVGELERATA